MEKPSNLRGKIMRFLPKAASAVVVTFQSPPISPSTGKGLQGCPQRGSIIPRDAPRRLKNGSFDAREPASPIVSCVGQVKNRRKQRGRRKPERKNPGLPAAAPSKESVGTKNGTALSSTLILKMIFRRNNKKSGEEGGEDMDRKVSPSLGHLKQFASGRGVLANFDWRAHGSGAVVVPDGSDMVIPHSAPIHGARIGGEEIVLKPRKEINLWKRRTMVPPPPLRL